MGPGLHRNCTDEKAKEYFACVNNLFSKHCPYGRFVKRLKDGRVICTNSTPDVVKIFKIIENQFVQDLEFPVDVVDKINPIFCEIDENIILFTAKYKYGHIIDGTKHGLTLVDIRDNNPKIIQEIQLDHKWRLIKIIKLSNGIIAAYNSNVIVFFTYDEKNHSIKKFDEIFIDSKSKYMLHGLWGTNDGGFLSLIHDNLQVYDNNRKLQNEKKICKTVYDYGTDYPSPYVHYCDQYIFNIYYEGMRNDAKYYIDVYSMKDDKIVQTLEVKYLLQKLIKLNDNLLVASDENGNIFVFNIEQNFKLTQKEIFRAHEGQITSICKFDDNKILSISMDGDLKLWEIN